MQKGVAPVKTLSSVVLLLCLSCAALAQNSQDRKLDQAIKNGAPLQTRASVGDKVRAQAVLIPRVDARRIFGKEIADNYAVIEVNVGNKSEDAALIIHGIFIDYTHWALSGTPSRPQLTAEGVVRNAPDPFQASTSPNQIASEEYRVVRGQLLDAQMWTKRNWTMRALTFLGSVGGAYAFSISEQGIIRGLNAFSGVVVPGVRDLWPDGTIEQLNRVSDFGFQTNKVVPSKGGEVIVCFFPIDRFLTPGFKKLFQRSPALFFAPLQMLVDKSLKKEADDILKGIDGGLSVDILRGSLPCYMRVMDEMRFGARLDKDFRKTFAGQMLDNANETCRTAFGLQTTVQGADRVVTVKDQNKFKTFMALDFISQMSLNNVSVTVDGVMTVETSRLAADINGVELDAADCGDPGAECFWSVAPGETVTRTGTISGSYLTGGSVTIAEANRLGITDIITLNEGSSDQRLKFSFKLTKGIPAGTNLTLRVSKPRPGADDTIDSQPWLVPVSFTPGTPAVTGVSLDDNTLTITGTRLINAPPPNELAVTLLTPGKDSVKIPAPKLEDGKIVFDIPAGKRAVGCWAVMVQAGGRDALPLNNGLFEVPRTPKLTSAKVQGEKIVVAGSDLMNTESCGGEPLTFRLVKKTPAAGDEPVAAEIIEPMGGSGGELKLPAAVKAAADVEWLVQVLIGGVPFKDAQVKLDR
jgi:hypothetical protein